MTTTGRDEDENGGEREEETREHRARVERARRLQDRIRRIVEKEPKGESGAAEGAPRRRPPTPREFIHEKMRERKRHRKDEESD